MKKLYTIILASAFAVVSFNSQATVHPVAVGVNATGGAANSFFPAFFNAQVGDTILFTLANASVIHNVTDNGVATGCVLPATAPSINSGPMSTIGQVYQYVLTVAGSYVYVCTNHTGMQGSITVATGINEAIPVQPTTAFPSPCVDKITFKYNGIDKISLFNVIGEQLKTATLSANEGKLEMDMADVSAGIYFFTTYREGVAVETKRIVKAK